MATDPRWLLGFRNRPDRMARWWAVAAEHDLDLAVRVFWQECAEDSAAIRSNGED